MIYPATKESIAAAAAILQRGGLVAFPTETVYGLGADANNHRAIEAIYLAKERPRSNPLIVHIAEKDEISRLAILEQPLIAQRLDSLAVLWPGPLSIILPAKPGIAAVQVSGLSSIAVRIPNHVIATQLISAAGTAIAAPSANPSNFLSPTSAQHVAEFLGSKIEMILDGGVCGIGIESTVVDISSPKVRILRPGFVLPDTISSLLSEQVEVAYCEVDKLLSPGSAAIHYAPRTNLSFVSNPPENISELRFGYISFSESGILPHRLVPAVRHQLSTDHNLIEIAAGLYGALHRLDQMKLDWILIDQCVNSGLGLAIMDRLSRAVTEER